MLCAWADRGKGRFRGEDPRAKRAGQGDNMDTRVLCRAESLRYEVDDPGLREPLGTLKNLKYRAVRGSP